MEEVQVQVQQISFRPDGIVEISYVDPLDQMSDMALVKVLMFDADRGGRLLQEVRISILDLLDEMLRELRRPRERKASRVASDFSE